MKTQRDIYRLLTAAAVLIVAAIAAVISFEHISALALKYGQPALSAYLMPLSVDGLVTVSSLAMFRSARAGLGSPVIARAGLFLGILATLGANVASGVSHGPVGAVIAGWPAVAFVISAEIAIGMVRRKPARIASAVASAPAPVLTVAPAVSVTSDHDTLRDVVTSPVPSRLARMRQQEETVLSAVLANPHVTYPELAGLLGTSERTARRVRDRVSPRLSSSNGQLTKAMSA